MIAVEELEKGYDDQTVLRNLTLAVDGGTATALVGPNGAGKSLLLHCLLGQVHPDGGTVRILGRDPLDDPGVVAQNVGAVLSDAGLFARLSGREHVQYVGDARGVAVDPDALLATVGLSDASDDRASTYSTGMQQRLQFAMALVGDPPIVLLDEPFRGLDQTGVSVIEDHLEDLRGSGSAILLASHRLERVEAVCDRVAVLGSGTVVTEGPVEEVRDTIGRTCTVRIRCEDPVAVDRAIRPLEGVDVTRRDGATVVAETIVPPPASTIGEALSSIGESEATVDCDLEAFQHLFEGRLPVQG